MVNKLNIQVTFGSEIRVFECNTRREFFNVICKHFAVSKEAIQLLDKEKQKPITINDLSDNMKVEVKKIQANGQRQVAAENMEQIKYPDQEKLVEKLVNNTVLTGLERKFIVDRVDELYHGLIPGNLKRKNENEVRSTANKKVQVPLEGVHFKNALSQTENLTPPSVETSPSTSMNEQSEIKQLAKGEKRDNKKAKRILDANYDQRRNFMLMTNPVVSFIREKHPLLFSLSEVRNELNRIFYPGKDIEFLSNIEKFSNAILSIVDEEDPFLKIIKNIYQCAKSSEKKYAKEVGALLIISNILEEKRLYLSTLDEPIADSNYPRIEADCEVEQLFYDKHLYSIIVEGILLCEATDFKEAILCLMASFFVFNISYPEKLFGTFALMEKVFLEANDTNANEIDHKTMQIIKLIQLKPHAKVKFLSQS